MQQQIINATITKKRLKKAEIKSINFYLEFYFVYGKISYPVKIIVLMSPNIYFDPVNLESPPSFKTHNMLFTETK